MEMCFLTELHPTIYLQVLDGRFVAHKTRRPFSGMTLDQAHEQLNALVKGDGGAVGLTKILRALWRWMVAGPKISCIIEEFEYNAVLPMSVHHERSHSFQTTFQQAIFPTFPTE